MSKILNLKCDNTGDLWSGRRVKRRLRDTKLFIEKYFTGKGFNVLDIGGNHLKFGENLSKHFSFKYNHTDGDLDILGWQPLAGNFDVILCLEVLEHLMNPALFMKELRKRCYKDTQIFISYPTNPLWLWGGRHFNEYTSNRFYTLISECGFKIEGYWWNRGFLDLRTIFTGIRPPIRFLVKILGLSRTNFYYLKLK